MLKSHTEIRLTWADASAGSCSTQLHIALSQVQDLDSEIIKEVDALCYDAEALCKRILHFNKRFNSGWDSID